ncbi:hypothetical protein L6164_012687 [Bauhinia variegata]|uniref:Uncharacterized protein n=1 Tax=Bauhinia variegata TaxID=167791 RepID=A0ACB9PCC4_BAUVA|nr:hypothetical protein L6164_012687 [Bauhinia variegata]
MDQHHQGLPKGGVAGSAAQASYGKNQYQSNQTMAPAATHSSPDVPGLPGSSSYLREHQLAQQYMHQLQQQELQQQLQNFWANQIQEIEQVVDFKTHSLPLARIKKIMKADEDVRMISAEAPVIFARACEMFILELTLRSWINAEENKRRTLQKNDIAAAITRTDVFDFLVDIVPRDDLKDDIYAGIKRPSNAAVGGPAENATYHYMPPQHVPTPYGAPRMIMGMPVVDQAHHYGQQTHPYPAQMWPQQQNPPADSDS